jgi:acid phosphatase (class A)
MYTLKEIRKILNIQEQDPNEDSWSDGDAMEDNKGDGKPFTRFELTILKLIPQKLTKGNMEDVLIDHVYSGEAGRKWQNIAKLVGLRSDIGKDSIEDIAYDKRYVKWAVDNWTENGDYASIEKPIKTPPKRYDVDREESGNQVEYKDGSTSVIADAHFWDWGGEMQTTDYGDYETYDSSITNVTPTEVLSEEKQKEFNDLVKLCELGEKYTPKIVGGVTKEILVEFLKENINDMVYIDEPKEKHVRRMASGLGPLEGFPIERFKNMPPPENESTQTEEEIDYLGSIPVEKNFIESADDIDQYFKKFLESKELEFPEEELKGVMKGVKSIILQLKYHYNRPRPYQVAKAKNLQLDSEHLKSASTPSYPSGHATQGTFIGRYLSDLYPEYEKELRQVGEDISFSRNMAKVHYPSDSEFGKILGNDLYEFLHHQQESLDEETDIFGQGLGSPIGPEEFEGSDGEWKELIKKNETPEEYDDGGTDAQIGFVAPSSKVADNICKVKGFCQVQGPITFGQLRELVETATNKRIITDLSRGAFKTLWRIIPFFLPQILLASVGVTVTRAINKVITPALKDTKGYKSWWGKVVLKAMDIAEGDYIPDVALGDDPLSKIFFISDGLLQMVRDKYKLKFARYVAEVAANEPDNKPVPEWFVENLLRDYLNQKFLLNPPLPIKTNTKTNLQEPPYSDDEDTNGVDLSQDDNSLNEEKDEPDWSIRRGKQHYAMNVENTPTEPRTAFNNYLVKNSPFIIEGFDFYLSAVPGNMPGEARVDVYVPMMDDSTLADEIWNTERNYMTREYSATMGDWDNHDDIDHYEFTEHTDMLHNIGYDQKFGEYYYYEDFQEKFPEHIKQISTQLEDTNLLNAPGKQYEHMWRSKRNALNIKMVSLSKLFGLDSVVINRDPQRPWKRQVDSYGNEEIRPGKSVPREWPRS